MIAPQETGWISAGLVDDPDRTGVQIEAPCKVHPSAQIGPGSVVWAFASIHPSVVIGAQCSIAERAYIGRSAVIGDRVRIGEGAHITDHMVVEDDVFIGARATFTNDRHPRVNNPWYHRECPHVEAGATVGVAATILPGVRIGRGAMVGQGAVVTKDVPAHTTVVGNPARPIDGWHANEGDA